MKAFGKGAFSALILCASGLSITAKACPTVTTSQATTGGGTYTKADTVTWSTASNASAPCCRCPTDTTSDTSALWDQTLTKTISFSQDHDFTFTLSQIFSLIAGSMKVSDTKKQDTTETIHISIAPQTVKCGQKFLSYQSVETVVESESENAGGTDKGTRSKTTTSYAADTHTIGINDSYDPCKGVVTTGAPCPTV